MRSPSGRLAHLLALGLTLALLLTAALPARSWAQDPPPPAAEEPTPAPADPAQDPAAPTGPAQDSTNSAEQIGEIYTPAEPAADPAAAPAAPAEPALPDGYTPPAEAAELSPAELAELGYPNQVQGPIRLDLVINPGRLTAGGDLTYTYIFTNTTATPTSVFYVRARFTSFALTNSGNILQYCKLANCEPDRIDRVSPVNATVSRVGTGISAGEVIYRVEAALGQNQAGRFQVTLSTRADKFPLSGQAPVRPAGSAILSSTEISATISEDTANALFVGPIFVLTKARTSTPTLYYPGQDVEFTITLGNATASGDSSAGVVRTDAVPAANINLSDRLPAGAEFVSADGGGVFDQATNEVRWNIAGPLNPGQSLTFKVRFRKLDVAVECGRLNNSVYSVTSDQMPIQSGVSRYRVSGRAVSADIRTPLVVQSINADPSNPLFGEEATITIRVQSFWDKPISGLELRYAVQSNAFYVPGRIAPTPGVTLVSAPSGATPGGDVVWRLDMDAGSLTAASTRTVQLVVRGAFTNVVAGGTGVATIVPPAGVPSACISAVRGLANFQPRLYGTKNAAPEMDQYVVGGRYLVTRGSSFTYIIKVENRSDQPATDVRVIDQMPAGNGANFAYDTSVPSTLNGQPFAPIAFQNGEGGTITWEGIDIAANSSAEIRFNLTVDGFEYVDHCNNFLFEAADGAEPVREVNPNRLCVRISPPLTLTKTASRTTIDGNNPQDNRQVTFTLSYTNRDSRTYTVGLYDIAGAFDFVRMEDGNPPPTLVGNNLEWPSQPVAPGQTISVRFTAVLVPTACANRNYPNELGFVFAPSQGGEPYVVRTVPATVVNIAYTCGQKLISYSKAVDSAIVSTRDRHLFTLNVKNESTVATDTMNNVRIIDVLPTGFTYDGMGANSAIKDQPTISTREDGRVQLVWTRSSLAPNTATNVQFYARSGEIVGTFTNWLRATADGIAGVRNCPGSCSGYITITDEGEDRIYAVRNVQVQPLATVEPSIDRPAACAATGENRTYQIALVNTNRHAYANTVVTATIPLGLHFDGIIGATPAPKVIAVTEKGTVLSWENLFIAAKPSNATATQLTLQVRLRVGQVWGPLQPRVEANSPDGSLPRKDGVLDPTIRLCAPTGPAIGKDASSLRLLPNAEYFYVFSLINPGATPLTGVAFEDTLSSKVSYLSTPVGAAPAVSGQRLSWSGLTVPAATQSGPGVLSIVIKVRLNQTAVVGDIIPNRVAPTGGATLNTENADVDVQVVDPRVFVRLPLIRR
jgi:uncharacterized repeat protein (TIGR01451 family)